MNFLPGNKTDSKWIQFAGSFLNLYHWANFWVWTELLEHLTAASGICISMKDGLPLAVWTRGFLAISCMLSALQRSWVMFESPSRPKHSVILWLILMNAWDFSNKLQTCPRIATTQREQMEHWCITFICSLEKILYTTKSAGKSLRAFSSANGS